MGGWQPLPEGAHDPVDPRTFRRVVGFFKPYWRRIAITVLAILVVAGLGLINPFLLRAAIDEAIPNRDLEQLYILVGLMIAVPIITGVLGNTHQYELAVNVPNRGLIPNLPDWAVVEAPGVAGPDGLRGVQIGPLPKGIAALCRTQVGVQDLCVDAAVLGSRELALQAMLADPVVQDAEAGRKCLDELLSVHAPYLPQFSR